MKKVKYRFYVDYEKEEQWVNEMAQNGWHFKKIMVFRYTLVKGEPGAYIYRNELLAGLALKNKNDYLEFLKESGIEVVNKFGGWAYFRKKAAEGPFEIYTDTSSKISYYNRILNLFTVLFLGNLIMGIFNLMVSDHASYRGTISSTAGIFGIATAILILIPNIKIYRRKNAIKEQQQIFEE
ncbi:DUF2812 domain-containing protein [Psychrobacillus glaciei]|uniref:DUF2812 domain-containing protein n=1 Tax=Psychrobacillus glaciei TaxID=2283160 RepID=A0A5J6STC9_9BACI|nr:DUF2812 domain-containing protein [Psychrobacillus glaciei]QFG00703.1 DUF2812 domain-containing protein [Psychrobacillus glaciei]